MVQTLNRHSPLARSLWLSAHPFGWEHVKLYSPLLLARRFNAAGIRFVLAGVHGLAEWVDKPRCSLHAEFIVGRNSISAAVAVAARFRELAIERGAVEIGFRSAETNLVVIRLRKPHGLLAMAFANALERRHGGVGLLIPSRELGIAMTFADMTDPLTGQADWHQHAHDFMHMISAAPTLEEDKLAELGEHVFPGGGQRLLGLVADVKAGRKLVL